MFNNYYDSVKYKPLVGEGVTGDNVYGDEVLVRCRLVDGGKELGYSEDKITVKVSSEYQVPFQVNIGDMLDGKIVESVVPSKDVFGKVQFWVVKVL